MSESRGFFGSRWCGTATMMSMEVRRSGSWGCLARKLQRLALGAPERSTHKPPNNNKNARNALSVVADTSWIPDTHCGGPWPLN